MATAGGGKKGGKKKKGQTVPLTAFLADSTYVAPPKKLNWAEDSDDTHGPIELAEEYGGPPMDLRNLPSAPRASRSVDLDLSRLPSKPPYTAFLGNLPFDVTEEDIRNLFRGLRVENIRFPEEGGRLKGFGYAEFFDTDQLKSALALSNEKIRNRQIRIDIADQAGKDGMGRDNRGGGFDDKTSGDWRRDDGPTSNDARNDDRRGGYRDDRRGGDREPRALGPADTDDCWRRSDDGPAPPSNTWGNDRGGRGRDDNWGGRGGGFRDDRGGGFRDDRGGGFRDDRGGGFRDDRGGGFRDRGGGFRDDRGGGFRDDRGGGFRDDRGGGFRDNRGGGFRDDRGGGFRDDRGGGFRDDRGGGFDRGFSRDGPRDGGGDRDGGRFGGPREDRDGGPRGDEPPTERKKLNLKPRSVEPKVEEPPADGASPTPPPAAAPAAPAPAPAPVKSSIFGNAKPVDTATKERQIEEKLSTLHVNGDGRRNDDFRGRRDRSGDRPRERSRDSGRGRSRDGPREGNRDQPRERSRESQEYSRNGPRAHSRDGRDLPRDGGYEGRRDHDDRPRNYEDDRERSRPRERAPPDGFSSADNYPQNGDSRREYRDSPADGEPENWRDESLRHDKPRVMRPDLVNEADKGDRERTVSDSSDGAPRDADMSVLTKPSRDEHDSRGSVKSPKGKKWGKDVPVVPPKYEEPAQPVFSQVSRFAALGMDDDEVGEGVSSDEEEKEQEVVAT